MLFFALLATFPILFPTVVAEQRIEMALGALTKLETINEINKSRPTKYYTLKKFYIDKSNISVHTSFDVSGRRKKNKMLNMHIYIVSAILKNQSNRTNSSCLAWLGTEYSDQIRYYRNDRERDKKYQAFAKESMKDFYQRDVNQFVYLERVRAYTVDGDRFKEAVDKNPKYSSNTAPVFLAVNKPFEKRNDGIWNAFFIVFGIAQGIWLTLILLAKFSDQELDRFASGKTTE